MRLKIVVVILVVLVFITAVVMIANKKNTIELEAKDGAVLQYQYKGVEFTQELQSVDAEEIKSIINRKRIHKDNPSCGFSESISIHIGIRTFCVAQDSCGILQVGKEKKYIYISDSERKKINEIFRKYGGTFPCI